MVSAVAAFADSPSIRSIDVRVLLEKDGSALVSEQWDVRVTSGTEWYLNRENLGDIEILDLKVVDERDGSSAMSASGTWTGRGTRRKACAEPSTSATESNSAGA